jgi:phosphoglycerol transferase MdoB-like AlkP superfamily enzyme
MLVVVENAPAEKSGLDDIVVRRAGFRNTRAAQMHEKSRPVEGDRPLPGIPLFARYPVLTGVAVMLLLYTVTRLIFLVANLEPFSRIPARPIFWASLHGIRFDLVILLLTNLPVIVLTLATPWVPPSAARPLRLLSGVLFVVLNVPGLVMNLVDTGCYPFFGRRSTLNLLELGGDIRRQTGQLLAQYWFLFLIGLVLIAGVGWLGLRIARAPQAVTRLRWGQRVGVLFLTVAFTVLGIRGGWQLKPLSIAHANIYPETVLSHLTLNTPFNAWYALRRGGLRMPEHARPWNEVLAVVSQPPHRAACSNPARDNVVILILESFGAEYSSLFNGLPGRPGYTPELDALARRSLYFTNAFANGRRSIEAVASILAGVPSLMDDPLLASPYGTTQLHPLPAALQRQGYATAFFHGGHNGSMMFDSFSRAAGCERYLGMKEYPNKADYDGHWGIFDGPYLQWCVGEMARLRPPFFATVFTLSSHNPYRLPPECAGRFPAGTLPIHPSIGYADFALGEFFRAAAREAWFTNTLFVVTGDHTSLSDQPAFQTELGHYRVPLFFLHPGGRIPARASAKVVQHADIPDSVLDAVGLPVVDPTHFGRSVFDESWGGRALNHLGGTYWLAQPGRLLRLRGTGSPDLLTWEGMPLDDPGARSAMQMELQAFVQYFTQGVIENRLATSPR